MSQSIDEDDVVLKDLVSKALLNNGTLGKVQAELRASVFLALEDEFKDRDFPLCNKQAKKLLPTPAGTLAASLVHDFLTCLGLNFSLSVFSPESNLTAGQWNLHTRDNMFKHLGLEHDTDPTMPILMSYCNKQQKAAANNGDHEVITGDALIVKDQLEESSLNSNLESRNRINKACSDTKQDNSASTAKSKTEQNKSASTGSKYDIASEASSTLSNTTKSGIDQSVVKHATNSIKTSDTAVSIASSTRNTTATCAASSTDSTNLITKDAYSNMNENNITNKSNPHINDMATAGKDGDGTGSKGNQISEQFNISADDASINKESKDTRGSRQPPDNILSAPPVQDDDTSSSSSTDLHRALAKADKLWVDNQSRFKRSGKQEASNTGPAHNYVEDFSFSSSSSTISSAVTTGSKQSAPDNNQQNKVAPLPPIEDKMSTRQPVNTDTNIITTDKTQENDRVDTDDDISLNGLLSTDSSSDREETEDLTASSSANARVDYQEPI